MHKDRRYRVSVKSLIRSEFVFAGQFIGFWCVSVHMTIISCKNKHVHNSRTNCCEYVRHQYMRKMKKEKISNKLHKQM